MTKEEKQLLIKDLCARLPYGVKYCRDSWNYEWDKEMSVVEVLEDIDKDGYINYHKVYKVDDIKPYLRPMSNMTKEEKYTYRQLGATFTNDGESIIFVYVEDFPTVIDWLNAHHFDFRNLIEKGLAIDCTNLDIY